jgi:hypothetical protein
MPKFGTFHLLDQAIVIPEIRLKSLGESIDSELYLAIGGYRMHIQMKI